MKIITSCTVYLVSLLLFLPITAYAEVIFHDAICLLNDTVMLKAETRGKVFSKGGKLIEFFVNGKSIGRSLSGGDGFAFKEFTPRRAGLHKISVISGTDKDNGLLLSLKKGARLVFIDVEGSVFTPFSKEPMKGSQKVIKAISKRFPLVYLQTRILTIKTIKKWLGENEFISAPVLPWQDGAIFDDLNKKGLKIKFIIGSAPVIESAKEFKPRAFSFEDVEGAEEVKDWEETEKKLRSVINKICSYA